MNKVLKVLNLLTSGKMVDRLVHYFDEKASLRSDNIYERQAKMLKRSLSYANKNCRYYQKLDIEVNSAKDITKYPFLTKKMVRENYQEMISYRAKHMIYHVAYTGGSTGEPLQFLNSNYLDGYFQEKLWRRNEYRNGDSILAMDGSTIPDTDIAQEIYWQEDPAKQLPYGGYVLSSLYLTQDNIKKYMDYICKLKPSFIRGYPSFIYTISKYILDNKIELGFVPKGIELTAESSFTYQHDIIRAAFGSRLFQQYGHTECCTFGYTFDDTMRYVIEPLYGYVEVIADDGRNAEIGETGEIVVTSLHNNVMPLIRYRTGDYALYGGQDKMGLLLNAIYGRTQDYLINSDSEKVLLTALIFAQHFSALGNIVQWQIEQYVPGEVVLHVIKGKQYGEKDEVEIAKLFLQKGKTKVHFDYVDNIPLTPRGKSKMIIQHIYLE